MLEDIFFFFPTSDAEILRMSLFLTAGKFGFAFKQTGKKFRLRARNRDPKNVSKCLRTKVLRWDPLKKKFYQNRNFGHIFFGLKFAIAQVSGHPSEDPISMGSNPWVILRFFSFSFQRIHHKLFFCERPRCHVEYVDTYSNPEVEHHLARKIIRWETAWELLKLLRW